MAAAAVGAQPILVLTGKGEKTLRAGSFPKNTVIFPDLAFAAAALLLFVALPVTRSLAGAFVDEAGTPSITAWAKFPTVVE